MQNFFIGSLKIHDNTNQTDFWLQTPLEGFESPPLRINQFDKPGEDGSTVSSIFYSGRAITLPGGVKGASPAIFEANRQLLINACSTQKDNNGYPTPTRCTFTTLAGLTYYFDAYFDQPTFVLDTINFSNFLLKLRTASPFIFGSTGVSSGQVTRATGGGFILPVILPITSAAATGGSVSVNNRGSAIAYPLITLSGPLTNPYINNTTIGKIMQLTTTLGFGDTVVIDMLNKTIMLNNSTSLLSAKTPDSEWWGLVPGNNTINFSTGGSSDTGNMAINFNPAYVGI